MRLDINYKKKIVRNINTLRLNSMFLNNQVYRRNQKGNKKFLEKQIIMTQNSKPMGCSKAFIATQSYLKKQEKY